MNILVIEDDERLSETIERFLTMENYSIQRAADGWDALSKLGSNVYDLLVLDWGLPGPSGIEICSKYRESGGRAPVLFLTGRSNMEDLSIAYQSGADDYLKKPFQMQELLLRVSALLRRTGTISLTLVKRGNLVIDSNLFMVTKNGKELHLSRLEFQLLELLMRNPGKLFSPEELLEAFWKERDDKSDGVLRTCIKKLRVKIDDADAPSYVQNFHGLGYKFVEPA